MTTLKQEMNYRKFCGAIINNQYFFPLIFQLSYHITETETKKNIVTDLSLTRGKGKYTLRLVLLFLILSHGWVPWTVLPCTIPKSPGTGAGRKDLGTAQSMKVNIRA